MERDRFQGAARQTRGVAELEDPLLQEKDHLPEAGKHLAQAKERIKKDPGLQSYLKAVTTKVYRAEKVEDKFSTHSSVHFTVKSDGSDDPDT